MAGRKKILTKKLIEEAVKWIKAGNYACVVCEYLGIGESTWYSWLSEGEKYRKQLEEENPEINTGNEIYLEFAEAIKIAQSEAEIRNVTIIQTAAKDTWQAAAWYLERKHKDRWANKQIQEHTGKDGGPIKTQNVEVDLSKLSDEELEQYEQLTSKATNSE